MIVGLDWDGTVCETPRDVDVDDVEDLLAKCRPRPRMIERIAELHAGGHVLDVVTARGPHVRPATELQIAEWLTPLGVQLRSVHHRPRLVFDYSDYVPDKTHRLRQLKTDVYVGDRAEDMAAALRAGARFLWFNELEENGLQVTA